MDCTLCFTTNQKIRVHACQTILVHIRKIQPSIFACTLALLKHNCDLTHEKSYAKICAANQNKCFTFDSDSTFCWCWSQNVLITFTAPYVWTFLKRHTDVWPAPSVCCHRVITCFTLMWLRSPQSDAKFILIWWNISYLTTVLFFFSFPRTLSLWTTASRALCRPCTDPSPSLLPPSYGSSSAWWKGSTEETASAASLTSCFLPRGFCRSSNKKPA